MNQKFRCLYQSGIKSYQIDGIFIEDIAGPGINDGEVSIDSDMFKGRSAGSIKINPVNNNLYVVDGKIIAYKFLMLMVHSFQNLELKERHLAS